MPLYCGRLHKIAHFWAGLLSAQAWLTACIITGCAGGVEHGIEQGRLDSGTKA